ncbi:peptidase propeptide and YpeB domain protein [Streptomyces montanus]|uniref:Peptidase propeptide and YpeB domain protein n=1 Tax=Streptomyces montanus TaxID=2580423 RepID=A0A5R9FJH4_9ACTN|nr:PepSY domain-containing protein [Streptomyces montanus]TLS40993.1 peptidase propeptide and YpeB domain protein [Streptomyces montanus]
MKRNIVIATIAAAALVGGGTATALAVTSDGAPATTKPSGVAPADNSREDADDKDDTDDRRDKDDRDDSRADDDRADGGRADDDTDQVTVTKVTAAEAIESALRHTSGTVVSADLDGKDEDGPANWEVEVLAKDSTWHSVRLDPATGDVIGSHVEKAEQDDADDTAQVRAALKGTSVSAEEAAKAAAAKGTVTSVDLDDDGKSPSWGADTRATGGTEREWNVDLNSARVTADKDNGSDDGSDDADDSADDAGSDD